MNPQPTRYSVLLLTLALGIGLIAAHGRPLGAQPVWPVTGPTGFGSYTLDTMTGAVTPQPDGPRSPDDSEVPVGTGGATGGVKILDVASGNSRLIPGTDAHFTARQPNGSIIPTPYPDFSVTHEAWSPDGRFLAFVGMPPGDAVVPALMVWQIGSPETRRLLTFLGGPAPFAWRPDSSAITTLQKPSSSRSVQQIQEFDPLTGQSKGTLFESDAGRFESLVWSPDASFLALAGSVQSGCSGSSQQAGIWTWEAAGGALRQIYNGGHGGVKWTNDGAILTETCGTAQLSQSLTRFALVRFSPTGDDSVQLAENVANPAVPSFDAAFDTGGGAVLFTRRDCQTRTASSWIVGPGSDNARQLSDPAEVAYESRLAPDGSVIASLLRGPGRGSTLVLADPLLGFAQAVLTSDGSLTKLSWSPGGRWLNFDVTRPGYWDC
jgi:WD40 repeat protein